VGVEERRRVVLLDLLDALLNLKWGAAYEVLPDCRKQELGVPVGSKVSREVSCGTQKSRSGRRRGGGGCTNLGLLHGAISFFF
jgi:hypothetical protein